MPQIQGIWMHIPLRLLIKRAIVKGGVVREEISASPASLEDSEPLDPVRSIGVAVTSTWCSSHFS